MKIPLWKEVPEFKPRAKIGVRRNMSIETREILDAIDVIEQKSDFGNATSVNAYNLGLLIVIIFLLVEGPAVLKVVQHWLSGGDVSLVGKAIGLIK